MTTILGMLLFLLAGMLILGLAWLLARLPIEGKVLVWGVLLCAITLWLTGCAHSTWTRADLTPDQWQRDLYDCTIQASGATTSTTVVTTNNPQAQLSASAQQWGVIAQRERLIDMCLEAKGYRTE